MASGTANTDPIEHRIAFRENGSIHSGPINTPSRENAVADRIIPPIFSASESDGNITRVVIFGEFVRNVFSLHLQT